MSIKENSAVKVVTDNPVFAGLIGTGKVVRVYSDLGIAIVRFESGPVKIPVDCLAEVEQKNENQESKIQEGAKRISKKKFLDAIMTVSITGMKIADEIFKDQDVVTMTEDQFIGALWDSCNPVELSKGIEENMMTAKCLMISLMSISSLRKTISILFGDGSENA